MTELGDPAALAAGYADRPLHLIGPKYYLVWWRLLRLLLLIVPACVLGVVALGQAVADAPIGTIIGQSIVAGLGAVLHVCFWVTVVFVTFERTGADAGGNWDVGQLPKTQRSGTRRIDLIAGLMILGLATGAMLWDRFRGFVHFDGEMLPVLNLGLWPRVLVLIRLQAALTRRHLYVHGRWDTAFAVVNTLLAVPFAGLVLTALVRGQLFNTEFLHTIRAASGVEDDVLRTLAILVGIGAAGISVWSIIDGWLKNRSDARCAAPCCAEGSMFPVGGYERRQTNRA